MKKKKTICIQNSGKVCSVLLIRSCFSIHASEKPPCLCVIVILCNMHHLLYYNLTVIENSAPILPMLHATLIEITDQMRLN